MLLLLGLSLLPAGGEEFIKSKATMNALVGYGVSSDSDSDNASDDHRNSHSCQDDVKRNLVRAETSCLKRILGLRPCFYKSIQGSGGPKIERSAKHVPLTEQARPSHIGGRRRPTLVRAELGELRDVIKILRSQKDRKWPRGGLD
ncbi:hypothetical protein WMY93_005638 [Mugilogobius chulae]|uniref:Uncharacterized protein n=1 Tax=Mugilogobius chulae TaxID=88201 RepID=A0AAW0PHC7_9GOBI